MEWEVMEKRQTYHGVGGNGKEANIPWSGKEWKRGKDGMEWEVYHKKCTKVVIG